ncbi:MAG: winged helix-turn-helix transcriptional regulator [Chloroflexota bacterium]
MDSAGETARDLGLLEEIDRDPDTTQATLATRLGVAVGTVNWHLKRLIAKGYVKVKRAERRKLRYILTPEGIALRARLTVAYVERSMTLYRQSRERARKLLAWARERGYRAVRIEGDGDIADVCRLTCLEQGMAVAEDGRARDVAVLAVRGQEITLLESLPPARTGREGEPAPATPPSRKESR